MLLVDHYWKYTVNVNNKFNYINYIFNTHWYFLYINIFSNLFGPKDSFWVNYQSCDFEFEILLQEKKSYWTDLLWLQI